MIPARKTESCEFIDPKILHILEDNAPGPGFENQSIAGDLQPDLHTNIFKQIGQIQQEKVPDSEQFIAMLKALLPKSVLDNHLARRPCLIPFDEDLKSDFARLVIFSTANNFAQFDSLPINMMQYLRISMDTGFLKSLRHAQGPESEALVENFFRVAIESQDAGFVQYLLLNTALDCNKMVCNFQGRRYTPIERASQLRCVEVVRKLIAARADVNKTFGSSHEIVGHWNRPSQNLIIEHRRISSLCAYCFRPAPIILHQGHFIGPLAERI